MSVAKVIEISASSTTSFDDAVKEGIARASKTIQGIKEAWVYDFKAVVDNGQVVEYRVHMRVSFLLNE